MKQKTKKIFPYKKKTEKNLLDLEKNLSELEKYYNYAYIEYKGRRNVRNLFDLPIDEDYYKPIRTSGASNGNYFEYAKLVQKYRSIEDKEKVLTIQEYLDMIRPNLSDVIHDHLIQGEWKIQLSIQTDFYIF